VKKASILNRGPQAARLPVGTGTYQYRSPGGGPPRRIKGNGFRDAKDNIWEWAKSEISAGVCEHWNVSHPDGRYSNIRPDGEVHHGTVHPENF
jgi:hypothetical protein